MEACPCCTSLMQMCMWELLKNTDVLIRSVPFLPSRIHCMLFAEAAVLLPRLGRNVKESIVALVSNWPKDSFIINDLLNEKQLHTTLHGGTPSLLSMIMEGLLNLRSTSELNVVDFTAIYSPSLFQLPILCLSKHERTCDIILKAVRAKYEKLKTEAKDEWPNLEAVVSWKLAEMSENTYHYNFQGKGLIEVKTECHLNLSDWIGIDDEIVGLAIHENSPFRIKISKLSVDNYHKRQVGLLKGFLEVVDAQVLSNLVIYGKRGGVNVVLWDMAEYFERFSNLKMFGMGTSGIKLQTSLRGEEPTTDQIFERAGLVFSKWTSLSEVFIAGVILTGQVRKILAPLESPLNKMIFYSCVLDLDDITYLSDCKHLHSLNELGLEYNNLQGMGDILSNLVSKAPNLRIFNLKETKLRPCEKLSLMYALLNCTHLDTFVMYENEDYLSLEAYEAIIEVACLMDSLREFYIFPFDYKPFEMFHKKVVDEAVEDILTINERENLMIFY